MDEDQARALLAGPFGIELARYPLRFCKAAFFGIPPGRGNQVEVNNGTASLIARGEDRLMITCAHVLDGFRRKRAESASAFFQIGNCRLDPLAQLVGESHDLDVAVVLLTPEQATEIVHGSFGIGEAFFDIGVTQPELAVVGEGIAFGGFPGDLRRAQSLNELNFGSYSCGATPATQARDDYLVCQFERDEWVRQANEPEPDAIGGLSGGPAFRLLQSPAGIMSYAFAGIVYEFSENFDLLYIRQARAIHDLMGWG
ncbi:hypothetical protein [Burkholderia pseudomallei]|uniref:hypothetical protein n=1 Tax=Burkholderia pseudomallei TaxID=28450 RepID=UPI00105F3CCE|nr:hypothetical protein [Burkholderia pseudomallei]MDA0559684.1 serine protease [Burkholderia pseudomallei]